MRNLRSWLLLLLALALAFPCAAQDLNARVQVIAPQIQNPNKTAFDALEVVIRDFLNNRKWSLDPIQVQERIDCNLVITITQWDGSSVYQAEAQIQSSRPVFGTSYTSPVLNITDREFGFSYSEGQPLDFSDQVFSTNLSSLLAFYAYVMVGMDYDTFSRFGGNPYYTRAQAVVGNAQNVSFAGWKAFESLKNRYWLVENLNSKVYSPIREVLYDYHRNGLDVMAGNPQRGRKEILATLGTLQKLDRQKQGAILNQVFFTAKADEYINILLKADPQDKANAFTRLSTLDPANAGKYGVLK